MVSLSSIINDNKFRPEDLPEFESQLFFEGDRAQRYIVLFTILLFLSTVIATQGVIEDSTATVIGAMIIAPLMTPIIATTAALMMGNAHRAWKSLILVAIPLSWTSIGVARDSIAQAGVIRLTNQWIGQYESDVLVRSVLVAGNTAKIIITGSEEPTTIEDLGALIRAEFDQLEKIELRYVPSREYVYVNDT